jgi:hypothetical protein
MNQRLYLFLSSALVAAVGCGGPTSGELNETLRLATPLASSESQEACFDRVKGSVLDGTLAIEDYEASLLAECGPPEIADVGEPIDKGEGDVAPPGTAGEPSEPGTAGEPFDKGEPGDAPDPGFAGGTGGDIGPAPDSPRAECYNAVKAAAVAEGWAGEVYEAELIAQCDGLSPDSGS